MRKTIQPIAFLLPLTLGLAACVSSVTSTGMRAPTSSTSHVSDSPYQGDWLKPSADLARRLRDQGARMPYLHTPQEKYDLVRWLSDQGEVAYPLLLETVATGNSAAAQIALSALASSGDPRLLPVLDEIPFPGPETGLLRLERARCHMVLGDWDHAPVLIEGLGSNAPLVRGLCLKALRETTRMQFGFEPQGDESDREAAIQRWEAWSAARSQDAYQQG
ncbi:MAG: hypothetical protein OSB42_04785 [Planctomycetota bacterium]|nr:hypothetical protein [Planctomycetota bacterium]